MPTSPERREELRELDRKFNSVHHPGDLDLLAIRKRMFSILYEDMHELLDAADRLAAVERERDQLREQLAAIEAARNRVQQAWTLRPQPAKE